MSAQFPAAARPADRLISFAASPPAAPHGPPPVVRVDERHLRASLLPPRGGLSQEALVPLSVLSDEDVAGAARTLLADFLAVRQDESGQARQAERFAALEVLSGPGAEAERDALARHFVLFERAMAIEAGGGGEAALRREFAAIEAGFEAIGHGGRLPPYRGSGSAIEPGRELLEWPVYLASTADLSQIERFSGYRYAHGEPMQAIIDRLALPREADAAAHDDKTFGQLLQDRAALMERAEVRGQFKAIDGMSLELAGLVLTGERLGLSKQQLGNLYDWIEGGSLAAIGYPLEEISLDRNRRFGERDHNPRLHDLGARDNAVREQRLFSLALLNSSRADRLAYLGIDEATWSLAGGFLADARAYGERAEQAADARFGFDDALRLGLAMGAGWVTGGAVTGWVGGLFGGGTTGTLLGGAAGAGTSSFVSTLILTEGDVDAALEAGAIGALSGGLVEYAGTLSGKTRHVADMIIGGVERELSGGEFVDGLLDVLAREFDVKVAESVRAHAPEFVAGFTGQLVASTIKNKGDMTAVVEDMENYVWGYAADGARAQLIEIGPEHVGSLTETVADVAHRYIEGGGDLDAVRDYVGSAEFLDGLGQRLGEDVRALFENDESVRAAFVERMTSLVVASGGDPETILENAAVLGTVLAGEQAGARASRAVDAMLGTSGGGLSRLVGELLGVAVGSGGDAAMITGTMYGELQAYVTNLNPVGGSDGFVSGMIARLASSWSSHGGDPEAIAADMVAYASERGVSDAQAAVQPGVEDSRAPVSEGEVLGGASDPLLDALAEVGRGDTGPAVEALQRRLEGLGFPPGSIDGRFGPATAAALGRFQRRELAAIDEYERRQREQFELPLAATERERRAGLQAEGGDGRSVQRVGRHTLESLRSPMTAWVFEGGEAPTVNDAPARTVDETRAFVRAVLGGSEPAGAPHAASNFLPEGVEGELSDAQAVLEAIGAHGPHERRRILADLSSRELDAWVDGMNAEPLSRIEPVLATIVDELSGDTLNLFYRRADDELKAAYVQAINEHGSERAQREFVDVAQRELLRDSVPRGSDTALLLDAGQMALDVVGIFDPTFVADGVNGVISVFRGDWAGAGISAAAMVPFIGDLAKAGKLGRWARTTDALVERALNDASFRRALEPLFEKISETLGNVSSAIWEGRDGAEREALIAIKRKIDDLLGAVEVENLVLRAPQRLVDDFAAKVTSGTFNGWKRGLLAKGFSRQEVAEIVYRGSLERRENIFGSWGRYLSEITLTASPGSPYHAHHIVEKIGRGEFAAANREILKEVSIDPLLGRENLIFAPNNLVGQHGEGPQKDLHLMLKKVAGNREKVEQVLVDWGGYFSFPGVGDEDQ